MSQVLLIADVAKLMREAVAVTNDEIRHEIHRESQLHRLIVNGVVGPWVSEADVAALGNYRATTDFFRASLPEVFVYVALSGET